MQRVVGGVEIERDLLGRLAMRIEEQIDEHRLHRLHRLHRVGVGGELGVARGFRAAQLQPVQSALARQRRAVRPPRRELACQRRHHRIVAQFVVVDQVFVAERNAHDALHDQRLDVMLDQHRIACVLEAGGQAAGQADPSVGSAEQQGARIRRDPTTIKRRHHRAAIHACKRKQRRATLCRHRGCPLLRRKALSQKNFRRIRAPMHLPSVRNAV